MQNRSFKRIGNRLLPEAKCERGSEQWEYVLRLTRLMISSEGGSRIRYEAMREEQTWEHGVYRRVRFRSCGTVGYGPTMWVKSRSGDILHGHDSKACQRVACQLCRQQRRYQGRGTKRTIFLLVEGGRPIGKVLIHRWLPECHQQ